MTTRPEKKLKRKKTTGADLPEDLVNEQILSRLPIKSVVRFKCVSKSWLSLFSASQFVKQHLTHNSARNPNNHDSLVAHKDSKVAIISRYNETVAFHSKHIDLVGSVRGVVCLRAEKLLLWNPAIRQFKEFAVQSNHTSNYVQVLGFGFNPANDEFVVLSCDFSSASIYYSGSGSWIDVLVPRNVQLLTKRGTCLTHSKIIVKDCPYWAFTTLTIDEDDMDMFSISMTPVKFDTMSNEFKLLPKFHFGTSVQGDTTAFAHKFVDKNDCLNLIVYEKDSAECMLDIYSLDGEEEYCVWSKMYSIGPLDFHRRHPSMYRSVSQGFYGGGIVFHDDGMFSCYDDKTDTIKCLTATSTTASSAHFISCFRYTPSLVFLEGMKSVYLPTQTRRVTGLCSSVPQRLINSL